MTDEIQTVVTPAVSVEAVPSVTAIETPAPAPASSPAAVESSVSSTAPVTEITAEPSSEVENILGDAKQADTDAPSAKPEKVTDSKPEAKDAVKSEEETRAEADASKPEAEIKPQLPIYDEFKLPEGVNLDKEQVAEFSKLLGEIEASKLDHAGYQVAGQKLVDLATKATADSINRLNDYYVQFHENQKKEWFESFKKDPEMGGTNLDKTVTSLREAVEQYAGNETQVAEFRTVMKETGVGNHPAVIRMMNNMAAKIQKYETEGDNGNGGTNRIVPGAKPAPSKVKDYQRFYGAGN